MIVMLGMAPTIGRAYQADDTLTKKWVLEQLTSPIRITISPNGEVYTVDNFTTHHIVGYRLGCVTEKAGKIEVRRKARLKQVDIPRLDERQSRRYSKAYTIYADSDFYPCIERKMKLAVLEVRFSDAPKWRMSL
jgi:hypothetical protein